MSDVSERLKKARERDEAASGDEEPTEQDQDVSEPQDEPQPQPAQPTEAQISKAFDSAGKSAEKHVAKIAPLVGASSDQVVPCPCCDFPGYVFAQRPPLEGDRLMAVKAVIGEEDVRVYRPATNAVECEACNGYGKLVRPTKVADQAIAVCTVCNGYGWHAPTPQAYTGPNGDQTAYYPPLQPQPPYTGNAPVYPGQPSG